MAKKLEKEFELVNRIIERHWNRAVGIANAESLMTYWTVGAFVSERLKKAQWGSKTVEAVVRHFTVVGQQGQTLAPS